MRLVAYIQKWFRPAPVQSIQIIPRDPFRVTMKEWRASPDLTRAAKNALDNPTVRQMADVLRTNHLGNWAIDPTTTIEQRAIFAAKCEGYGLALNDLEALAVLEKPADPIHADFAPENLELE